MRKIFALLVFLISFTCFAVTDSIKDFTNPYFLKINADGSINTAGIPVAIQDVNITEFLGSTPTSSNYLPFRLTNGSSYYDARDRNWHLSFGTDTADVSGSTVNAAQSGTWTTGRTWSLSSGSDSVSSVQSGVWTTGRTWTLSSGSDSIGAVQSGIWTVQQGTPPWSVSQSGTWTTGRTWTLSNGTDSIASVQSGAWTTGRTWTLSSGTDSIASVQSGNWNMRLQDGSGTAITSTLVGSKQSLDVDVSSSVLPNGASTEATLSTLNGKVANNYGVATGAVRTADQIGNATGAADFNAGTTGAQTLRTTSNITRNGTELSYNAGTSDANTFRTASNLKREGNDLDYNFGAASANTLRAADLIGNSTGAADFNYGTVGAQTLRVASQIGNATGAANFGAGATGAQTLRVVSNLNDGAANSITSQTSGSQRALDVGIDVAGVQVDPRARTWTLSNTTDSVTNSPIDGTRATYSAAIVGLTVAATPTDIFTITGSGTKTIRVLRVEFSGTLTTGAVRDILLIKRSTANSGGTSASVTEVPHDSNNAAATATVLSYTANPTLGNTVGTVRASKFEIPATNLSSSNTTLVWDFGARPSQAAVLRGTSQVLALNLNSVTSSGSSLDISIEWTEE